MNYKELITTLSGIHKSFQVPNTDERELRRYRQFYLIYPMLIPALSDHDLFRGTLSPFSRRNILHLNWRFGGRRPPK